MKAAAELNSRGWSKIKSLGAGNCISSLSERNKSFYYDFKKSYEENLQIDISKFDSDKLYEIEVFKSFWRAWLKSQSCIGELINNVTNEVIETYKLSFKKYKWVTHIYPIIHLPNDTSELGDLHTDQLVYLKNMMTIWIPLNDGMHGPISVLPWTHKIKNYRLSKGLKILFTLPFIKKILLKYAVIKRISHNYGEYLLWFGNTYHEGNLNISANPTVALVVRITSLPILSEPTLEISNLAEGNNIGLKESKIDYEKIFKFYVDINMELKNKTPIKSLSHFSLNDYTRQILAKIASYNLTEEEKEFMACAFNFLGLRLRKISIPIYHFLYGFLLSKKSLLSFEHILEYCTNMISEEEMIKFLDDFTDIPYSEQFDYILKDYCRRKGGKLQKWYENLLDNHYIENWG